VKISREHYLKIQNTFNSDSRTTSDNLVGLLKGQYTSTISELKTVYFVFISLLFHFQFSLFRNLRLGYNMISHVAATTITHIIAMAI